MTLINIQSVSEDGLVDLSIQDLRDAIAKIITPTLEVHRLSRSALRGVSYYCYDEEPVCEEVDDFMAYIFSSGHTDVSEEDQHQLIDPGLLGYSFRGFKVAEDWLNIFLESIKERANDHSWLTANLPWLCSSADHDSVIWHPYKELLPTWLSTSPSCLLSALELLQKRKSLSSLHWRTFEELIGTLLEADGWKVRVT